LSRRGNLGDVTEFLVNRHDSYRIQSTGENPEKKKKITGAGKKGKAVHPSTEQGGDPARLLGGKYEASVGKRRESPGKADENL